MEITQIHVNYLDTEDRILMRVNFGIDQQVDLTLTRRITRFILENIAAMPSTPLEVVAAQTPIAFEERPVKGSASKADSGVALILNATCQRTDLAISFTFVCATTPHLDLNLSLVLAKGLEKLLWPVVEQAQWFVAFSPQLAASNEQASDDPLLTTLPASRLIH